MDEREFGTAFVSLADRMPLRIESGWLPLFYRHLTLMLKWNARVNLTSVTSPVEVIVKHFLDSLAVCDLIPQGARVLDLGSGAGFPGVPVRIARPDVRMTLSESSSKKRAFLGELLRTLSLEQVLVVDRLDPRNPDPGLTGRFDVILARAVAPLARLVRSAVPFLAPGGTLLAMKGPDVLGEVDSFQKKTVGPESPGLRAHIAAEYALPRKMGRRIVVVLTKSDEQEA